MAKQRTVAMDPTVGWVPEDSFNIVYVLFDGQPFFQFQRLDAAGAIMAFISVHVDDLKTQGFNVAEPHDLDDAQRKDFERVLRMEAIKVYGRRTNMQVWMEWARNLPTVIRFHTRRGDKDFRLSWGNIDQFRKGLKRTLEQYDLKELRPIGDAPTERPVITDPKGRSIGTLKDLVERVDNGAPKT